MGAFKGTLKIFGGMVLGVCLLANPVLGQSNAPEQNAPPAFRLDSLPDEWQWQTVTEPLWDSDLFVLQAGEKGRPVVLLIHGLGPAGFTDWLDVIPVLAEDYHVIAVDLPGFGRSGHPPIRYSPDNYARLLSWLVPQLTKDPITVMGHSMGGAVALRYGASYPDQVAKLILVDAAGILERTALLKANVQLPIDTSAMPVAAQTLGNKLINFGHSLLEKVSVGPDPTSLLGASDRVWNAVFEGRPNINAAMALSMHDFTDAIRSLKQPAFLIWGAKDAVAPLRTGYLLEGQLAQVQLQVIEGAAHVPMKSHPKTFNRYLLQALQQDEIAATEDNSTGPQQKQLRCKNQPGKTYTGHYQTVMIENCRGVVLRNLSTDQLIITDSNVELFDVRVTSLEDAGIVGRRSVIDATNLTVFGEPGISSDATRWDIAGMALDSPGVAIEVSGRSRFIFSISQINAAQYRGELHRTIELEHHVVDSQL